jgi:hypothetical protein
LAQPALATAGPAVSVRLLPGLEHTADLTGALPRGDAPGIVGTGERHTRRVVSALLDRGVLASESTRARRCASRFPRPSRRAGYRGCSPNDRPEVNTQQRLDELVKAVQRLGVGG